MPRKKITVRRPEYLLPYRDVLLYEAAAIEQQEVRWHVAQMLPRLAWGDGERATCVTHLWSYLDDRSRIVRTFTMQALADFAKQDAGLRPRVVEMLEEQVRTGSPAVKSRGRKLLGDLNP